ncbi:MAG: GNAT family N-acetyltransferase [Candidatus Dadabacteria bacterium]|nr:MAG: GNAT family N-acetyltransferase [Candidatus Dadabacteria bacterium]
MTEYESTTIKEVDRKSWNHVLENSRLSTVFHTLEWIEVVTKTFNLEETLIIGREDGEPVCIFPFFKGKSYIFNIYGSPIPETGAMYGGPLWLENREMQESIMKEFHLDRGLFTSYFLKLPPHYPTEIFKRLSYEIEPVPNFILDLNRPSEDIWNSISKKARNSVRKAKKSGIEIVEGAYRDIQEYHQMHLETCKRNSLNPLDLAFLRELVRGLSSRGMLKILLAKLNDKTLSGSIFLFHKKSILYFMGDSYSEYLKLNPNDLIQWHIIETGANTGYETYDLGGAGPPGITSFKKKWGGTETPFYRVFKGTPVTRIFRDLYASARRHPWVSRLFRRNL